MNRCSARRTSTHFDPLYAQSATYVGKEEHGFSNWLLAAAASDTRVGSLVLISFCQFERDAVML